jgi:NarL family two-component system response regulator LiaR
MTGKIRVMIADDHRLVREGLKTFLVTNPGLEIVGEARDGQEAVEIAARLNPDVVLMDLVMPKIDGVAATRQILKQNPQTRILIVTSFTEDESVISAIQAGASGYLLKDCSPRELEEAIEVVYRGESYLPPGIARKVIRGINQSGESQAPLQVLTPREVDIVKLVAEGFSNEEIARQLYISVRTVSSHLWRVMKKIQADNRTQVALYAVHHGITSNNH